MFTEKDLNHIQKKGITKNQVNAQISLLKNGMSYSNLVAAATIGKGIEQFSESESKDLISYYNNKKENKTIIKFVPASGAASRMFKFLFQFLSNFNPSKTTLEDYIKDQDDNLIKVFSEHLKGFPFYEEVLSKVKEIHPSFQNFEEGRRLAIFVELMLQESGLNYSFLPKGLLPFHKYPDGAITAFQEHLFEATLYAASKGNANLHFTVSEKHHNYFKSELEGFKNRLETETNTIFNISYSYQKETTETLALTTNNDIFRNEDGSILFRPAGHGALLENLNDLDGDVVFIKNIDNIVVAEKNKHISEYKKLLGGVLLKAQDAIFSYLNALNDDAITEDMLQDIATFVSNRINVVLNDDFSSFSKDKKRTYLKEKLNKPIRVCGMVKNEGEPGGGPFWVKDDDNVISLQIVEFAQIDTANAQQADIAKYATHFNPTDLVCGIKNYKGETFNLLDYVDPNAAFITMKTQNGIDIKVLELPGLWNGSMAHWNSIFVEVPVETFNPVKTVNDLLKPAHQS